MSEAKSVIWKRNSRETNLEESSMKRMKLDDDDVDLPDSQVFCSISRTISSSSSSSSLAYSASDSAALLSVEDDHRSSSFSSSSEETNEIATNTRLPFLDLEEVNQISETEISTLINNNFSEQVKEAEMDSATTERDDRRNPKKKTEKSPTKAEIDDFFSAAEKHEHKRFTEKYNYDFVNDTPLEGRYQWVTLKP